MPGCALPTSTPTRAEGWCWLDLHSWWRRRDVVEGTGAPGERTAWGTAQLQAALDVPGPLIKADHGGQLRDITYPGKHGTHTHLRSEERFKCLWDHLGPDAQDLVPSGVAQPSAWFPQSPLKSSLVHLWVLNGVLQHWRWSCPWYHNDTKVQSDTG